MSPLSKFPIWKGHLILFSAFLTSPLHAQPADVSTDLTPFLADGKIPGLAAAAILDGKLIASGASGVRKHGDPTPVTVDDQFHIGSCTKSMTATLAAILVAEGKIKWQSTVAGIFPQIAIHTDFKNATLLELCSNSGGAAHDVPPDLWKNLTDHPQESESAQRDKLLRGILTKAPDYAPGTKNVYSNAGFSIAGAMLEKVSGKSYRQLIHDRLFKPMHMTSAGFGAAGTAGKIDQPYGHVLRNGAIIPVTPGSIADNPSAITPAGRVHLSVSDFAKYASLHLGTTRLPGLDAAALDFLHTPVAPSKDYACGWVIVSRPWAGGTALTHNGTNTMNYAVMWLAPSKKFAAVAACNIGGDAGAKACDDAVSLLIRKFLSQ